MNEYHKKYTSAGTDIDDVKRKNAESGMSYNEVKEFIAETTGGYGTGLHNDTGAGEVKKKNRKNRP